MIKVIIVDTENMKYWLILWPFILLTELVQLPYRIVFWIDKLIRRIICRMKITGNNNEVK